MRAFIIRPFGIKSDINFDEVERLLIGPALARVGAEGGTTIDIVEAGNIRVDMFRRLLTADLVVADLSIHNANVFYELGIRHALRDRSTLMMRSDADTFPFDLQTDRYFLYKKDNPGDSLEALVLALRRTIDSANKDSPVFNSLPELSEPDPSQFMVVPLDFGEEVARAEANNQRGDLALFSNEVHGFEWEVKGWRTVGRAQFDLKAFAAAKVTWEYVRRLEAADLDANMLLGTIYERLKDLVGSSQALDRALANKAIQNDRRAEVYALLARNAKTRWRCEWESDLPETRAASALRSPHLRDSFENYDRAFAEDLNHFYSGLNALAMLSIMIELAVALPDVWSELFETDAQATEALTSQKEHAARLAASVDLSLKATLNRLKRAGKTDIWAEISDADLRFITSKRPARVASAYRDALAGAPGFARESVQNQLGIYKQLEVLKGNLAEVIKVVGEPQDQPEPQQRKRVLLFAGHMIDAPERKPARFPGDDKYVALARDEIRKAVVKEMESGAGVACGYAGGASGGDLLFQEVCAELGIPTRLYLAMTAPEYVTKSVTKAGPQWVKSFWNIYNEHSARNQVRVLSETTDAVDDSEYLPAWLRTKPDYTIWQRNNLWMLFNALDEGCDPKSGDPNITLIALWDGGGGDGPGGTRDLVNKVTHLGARCEIIRTKELFNL